MRWSLLVILLGGCVDRALDATDSVAAQTTCQGDDCNTSVGPAARCKPSDWHLVALPESSTKPDNALAIAGDRVVVAYPETDAPSVVVLSAPIGTTSWSTEKIASSYGDAYDLGLAAASDGALLLRYSVITNVPGGGQFVVLGRRDQGAMWTLQGGPDAKYPTYDRSVAVDRNGVGHTTYNAPDGALHHLWFDRSLGTGDELIMPGADGFAASLALDASDHPHAVLLGSDGELQHAQLASGWQADHIAKADIESDVAFAIDTDGTLVAGYVGDGGPFSYRTRKSGSTSWQDGAVIADPDPSSTSQEKTFATDPNGGVWAMFQRGHQGTPAVVQLGKSTIDVVDSKARGAAFSIARDGLGGTHVVYYSYEDFRLHYGYKCE